MFSNEMNQTLSKYDSIDVFRLKRYYTKKEKHFSNQIQNRYQKAVCKLDLLRFVKIGL